VPGRSERALGGSRGGSRWLLLVCLTGCNGNAFLIGESRNLDDSTPGGGGARPPEEQRCVDFAEARLLDSTCWPTRHVGRWRGFVTTSPYYHHRRAAPFEYPSGELLLEVSDEGTATLRFSALSARPPPASDAGRDAGTGSAAADAGDAGLVDAGAEHASLVAGAEGAEDAGSRPDASVAGGPPALGLALGFPYHLRELRMSGGPIAARQTDPQLDFSLLIAEPWSELCAAAPAELDLELGPCVCTADTCGPDPELLNVSLSLSADAEALRGSARSQAPEGPLAAGWELVRQ